MNKSSVALLSTLLLVSSAQAYLSKKSLGDINNDGEQEFALEDWSTGGSAGDIGTAKIISGNRVVLDKISIGGNTLDYYKVVSNKIVTWSGDWNQESSKWNPHYYDFKWYSWDKVKKRYRLCQEGFTKKRYTYDQAKKVMPSLAICKSDLVLSESTCFNSDALKLAKRALGLPAERYLANPSFHLEDGTINYNFSVKLKRRNEKWHTQFACVGVIYDRSGKVKTDAGADYP